MKKGFLILMIAVLSLLAAGIVKGEEQPQDQPEPGVARVSLIHGDVSTQRGDSADWVATTVNAPLTRGDSISTADGSRAEIQLDYANVLRLSQRSEAKLADLTQGRIQLQVAQGLVNYTVFKENEADVEIDTPNIAVHPRREGVYRIEVISPSQTEVAVRKGEVEITTPQGSTQVREGEAIRVQGTDNPEYQVVEAPGRDDWDSWNKDRDHAIRDARSWQHANGYYTGLNDLDTHGRWIHVPDYGDVWSPYVGGGWAPYRDGRWVWDPYYGWTWVSYEPWGWAPYHYGRWLYYDDAWCWWPGPVYSAYRPIWGPAWVSFFGFGFGSRHFGFGLGFGFGSIGWLPIGPCDPFFPWWGGFRGGFGRGGFGRGFNSINVTNITNITNIRNTNGGNFVPPLARGTLRNGSNLQLAAGNMRVRRALTSMSSDQFGRARVPLHGGAVSAAQFQKGQLVAGTLPVVPTRASLQPTNRAVNPGPFRRGAPGTSVSSPRINRRPGRSPLLNMPPPSKT